MPAASNIVLCTKQKKPELSSTWWYKGNEVPDTAIEIAPEAMLVREKTSANHSESFVLSFSEVVYVVKKDKKK